MRTIVVATVTSLALIVGIFAWGVTSITATHLDPPADAIDRMWHDYCERTLDPVCIAPTPTPTVVPTPTPTPTTPAPTPTPTTVPTATPTSTLPPTGGFIGPEVAGLPTSGSAWNAVLAAADSSAGSASITCNQDNRTHPKVALAAGLVYARTGTASYRTKVIGLVEAARASASNCGNAILSLGRQLGAYILAADYVGYRDASFVAWVSGIRTQDFPASHSRWHVLAGTAANTSNNWGTFALASLTAADAYLRDAAGLDRDLALFRDYGDGSDSFVNTAAHQTVWECPAGYEINPASCTTPQKEGAAVEDASRTSYPTLGGYPAEAAQGYVLTAELLTKSGRPAWALNDAQVCRNAKWRERGGNINHSSADTNVTWVTNARCGFAQSTQAAGYGRVWGFTDWTHGSPLGLRVDRPERYRADISWCGGFYGMRVYESFNFGGPSRLFCGNSVHAVNVNLSLYGWSNRISSVQTRNTPSGCCHRMHLYDTTGYGGVFVSVKGNVDIANMQTDGRITSQVPGGFNNRASSMRTRID